VQERGVQLGMVFLDGTNIRGDLRPSETLVKLLAVRVAAIAPRLA
jgi:hypothetical protein